MLCDSLELSLQYKMQIDLFDTNTDIIVHSLVFIIIIIAIMQSTLSDLVVSV